MLSEGIELEVSLCKSSFLFRKQTFSLGALATIIGVTARMVYLSQ